MVDFVDVVDDDGDGILWAVGLLVGRWRGGGLFVAACGGRGVFRSFAVHLVHLVHQVHNVHSYTAPLHQFLRVRYRRLAGDEFGQEGVADSGKGVRLRDVLPDSRKQFL